MRRLRRTVVVRRFVRAQRLDQGVDVAKVAAMR